jgi:hypothetical protein
MKKTRSKLAGCIIHNKDLNNSILLDEFMENDKVSSIVYYYTAPDHYIGNYRKALEWIKGKWIDCIIIDDECWRHFNILEQAYIASDALDFDKEVYCIKKTRIQKMPLNLLSRADY